VSDVRRLARGLLPEAPANDPFLAGLAELEQRLGAGTAPEEIARLGRRLRDDAAARFRVPTTPGAPPDAERARDLYSMACTQCHGPSGEGDTPRAKTLDPPPARFKESARLRDLSPYRVYNALTFGVPGTAMASFRELPAADRWSLAFFVFQLGHEGEPAEGPVELTLAELADRTDRELVEALRLRGHPSPERGLIQARRFAAFAGPTTGRGGVGGR
jgi:high-affinity iron transporter